MIYTTVCTSFFPRQNHIIRPHKKAHNLPSHGVCEASMGISQWYMHHVLLKRWHCFSFCQKGEVGGRHLFLIMSSQEACIEKYCSLKCDNTVSGWNTTIFWKKVLHPSFVLKMKEAYSSITSASFYQTTVCTPDKTVFWIDTTVRTALTSCVISTNKFIPIAPT